MVIFWQTLFVTITIKNPKTLKLISHMVYVNEKFLIMVGCHMQALSTVSLASIS